MPLWLLDSDRQSIDPYSHDHVLPSPHGGDGESESSPGYTCPKVKEDGAVNHIKATPPTHLNFIDRQLCFLT